MSDKSTPGPKPKKMLSLDDLVPEKQEVKTSLGTVYVRHPAVRELSLLEGREDLGDAVLRLVVGRSAVKSDHAGLSDKDFDALEDADIALLVPAAIRMCGWPPMPGAVTVKELGAAARAGFEAHKQQLRSLVEGMRKKIGEDYSFLGKEPLDRLKEQMSGLAALRSGFSGSVQEALKQTESLSERVSRIAVESPSERFLRATEGAKDDLLHRFGESVSSTGGYDREREFKFSIAEPRIPSPEDSPIGRATLQTAEQMGLLVEKMDKLADIVGGLNQTLVTDVLPAWFAEVESGQEQAKVTLTQAADGLRWTKWAVIASVVATLLTAAWQVYVARDIDRGNGVLQERTEAVLKEQLKAQQALIDQQARDGEELRQILSRLQTQTNLKASSSGSGSK